MQLGDEAPGRVQVEDVVERELLALQLARGGDRVQRRAQVAVEGGPLVRVLAVAQVLDLLEREGQAVREDVVGLGHAEAAVPSPPPARSSRRSRPRSARCGGTSSGRSRAGWARRDRPRGRAARAAACSPPGRRPRCSGGSSWRPRAAWWGRRCRRSRAPPRTARPSRPCPRTGRGSPPPPRRARCACSFSEATCAGSSRRARMPPWIAGCSVFTRPSRISGKPGDVGDGDDLHLRAAQLLGGAARRDRARSPASTRPRASSTMPSLR